MASRQRTPEDVRRDIEREREQLMRAVTDFANVLVRKIAIGAATAIGMIAVLKLVRRRSR